MKALFLFVVLASAATAQVLYEEHFTSGAMQLAWHAWFVDSVGVGDSMGVISDPTTPGGDGWAGRISNENMGMAGLTYSGIGTLTNYSIDAWIFTVVSTGTTTGPYNGIAIRMDLTSHYYYRLVSDFDDNARLRLGYLGSGGMPAVIRDWTAGEIPGGVPSTSSWHKLKLVMIADSIWAYYDNVLLPSCPFIHDSIANGHFGVYTFNMSDTASTKCDDIIVRAEASAVAENHSVSKTNPAVCPSIFSDATTIRLQNNGQQLKNVSIKIYSASGELVKDIFLPTTYSSAAPYGGLPAVVVWHGDDDSGHPVPAGIYFVRSKSLDPAIAEKVILLR